MSYPVTLFRFYVRGSFHVAFAVLAMMRVTQLLYGLPIDWSLCGFVFAASLAGYNFVRYYPMILARPTGLMKWIAAASLLAVAGGLWCLSNLSQMAQIVAAITAFLTFLYAVPILGLPNARNWRGMKIYFVALCWTLLTVVIPIVNDGSPISFDAAMLTLQRFIIVIVLLLIFEIVDLRNDLPQLQTVPQQIGITKTKILGIFLLIVFLALDCNRETLSSARLVSMLLMSVSTAIFLMLSNPTRHRNFTHFWAESLPMLWWVIMEMMMILGDRAGYPL